ncbi:TPA: hypothetical protein ACH3X1_016079 [Trebouxia sp. C0004]
MGRVSEDMQLELIAHAIRRTCRTPKCNPLQLCDSEDAVSKASKLQPYKAINPTASLFSRQPLVWLQNCLFVAQTQHELPRALHLLAAYHETRAFKQSTTAHYLILRYSRANAQDTAAAVCSAFESVSPRLKVRGISTTVQPAIASCELMLAVQPCTSDSVLPYMLIIFDAQQLAAEVPDQPEPSSDLVNHEQSVRRPRSSQPEAVAAGTSAGSAVETGKRPADGLGEAGPAKRHAGNAGAYHP